MSFIKSLNEGKFITLAEIDPPKGVNHSSLSESLTLLKGRVDALLVTDMPSAVMKLGSLATAYLLKNDGFDVISNITCRDRNVLALQSDLLSASTLGIENIYITDGDDITFGDHPNAKPVMEVDAAQLLSITKALQGGSDLEANSLDGSPQFNVGAYLNIKGDGNIFDITVEEVEDQVQNDVSFLITPAIFDLTAFERVLQKVKHLNVPIIASVILLKSVATARFLNKHVDNVYVPDTIIERLYTAGDKQKESMTITAELINGMKNLCHGVNIMAMGWEDKIALYLDAAHI